MVHNYVSLLHDVYIVTKKFHFERILLCKGPTQTFKRKTHRYLLSTLYVLGRS